MDRFHALVFALVLGFVVLIGASGAPQVAAQEGDTTPACCKAHKADNGEHGDHAKGSCCAEGASCCKEGASCCASAAGATAAKGSCCAEGASCCKAGATCCEAKAEKAGKAGAGCCAKKADKPAA